MMRRPAALAVSVIWVAWGCSEQKGIDPGIFVLEDDSAGVHLVTLSGNADDLPTWSLSSEPVFEISGDASPYLGSVGEVGFLSDARLLVEDNQTRELRIFSGEGEFDLVGGEGEGPGEFQSITTLTVAAGDTFSTFDRRLGRISRFDPAGRLVNTIAVSREDGGFLTSPLDAWAIDSEGFVLHRRAPYDAANSTPLPRRDQPDVVLIALDRDGERRGPTLRFSGGYSAEFASGDLSVPFANRPAISVGRGLIAYTSGIDYEIRLVDRDLDPVRLIRWAGWRRPFTHDLIQADRDSLESSLADLREARPDVVAEWLDAIFAPSIVPDSLPALGSVILTDSGELWVSRFNPITQLWNEAASWHVLDSDGHPTARVLLPERARLAAVRGARVALVIRDSLDVEHVKVFDVVRHQSGSH